MGQSGSSLATSPPNLALAHHWLFTSLGVQLKELVWFSTLHPKNQIFQKKKYKKRKSSNVGADFWSLLKPEQTALPSAWCSRDGLLPKKNPNKVFQGSAPSPVSQQSGSVQPHTMRLAFLVLPVGLRSSFECERFGSKKLGRMTFAKRSFKSHMESTLLGRLFTSLHIRWWSSVSLMIELFHHAGSRNICKKIIAKAM